MKGNSVVEYFNQCGSCKVEQLSQLEVVQQPSEVMGEQQLFQVVGKQQLSEEVGEKQLSEEVGEQQLSEEVEEQQLSEVVGKQQLPKEVGEQQLPKEVGEQQLPKGVREQQLPKAVEEEQSVKEKQEITSSRHQSQTKARSPRARAQRVQRMLQHQVALVAKGAPLSRIKQQLGFTPTCLLPVPRVGLAGRSLTGEFVPQHGRGEEERGNEEGGESPWSEPTPGPCTCTASTTKCFSATVQA